MRTLLVLALAATMAVAASARAQTRMMILSGKGTRCLTAQGTHLALAACAGWPSQTVAPNFAVGGLQIGPNCLRRDGGQLLLAPCRVSDPDEVFEIQEATHEIVNSSGVRGCLQLEGGAAEWRTNQPVAIAPCSGLPQQRWLLGVLETAPGRGAKQPNDAEVELHRGDYVPIGGQFLVIK